MTKKKLWMVRAGKGGRFADEFVERGFVGIGWNSIPQTSRFPHANSLGDPPTSRVRPGALALERG
jgi:restriction system protein